MEQGPDQLTNWTASLAHKLAADESKEKYFRFLTIKPQFKCVMCKTEIVSSPVYQCRSGHLACSDCPRRGCRCTVCDHPISGAIRNEAIEEIIVSLDIICKYENLGCKSTCKYVKYMEHEKTCPFKPINCPLPKCKQAGVTNSLLQHLKFEHNISALENLNKAYSRYDLHKAHASFTLDSNITTKVLLRHFDKGIPTDSYLVHQVATDFGDRLHLTSLAESGKLKTYEINVEIKLADPKTKVEIQHCYKFKSKINTFDHDGLLIPRHEPGDAPATSKRKECTILVYDK